MIPNGEAEPIVDHEQDMRQRLHLLSLANQLEAGLSAIGVDMPETFDAIRLSLRQLIRDKATDMSQDAR